MASSLYGVEPIDATCRYVRNEKRYVEIPCPKTIKVFDKHMGGEDLMDSHIGRYKIPMKIKKRYFRLFHHLVDLTVVNAWVLYNRDKTLKGKTTICQKQFRIDLAYSLCKIGRSENSKRGRPSSSSIQLEDTLLPQEQQFFVSIGLNLEKKGIDAKTIVDHQFHLS